MTLLEAQKLGEALKSLREIAVDSDDIIGHKRTTWIVDRIDALELEILHAFQEGEL